MIRIASSVVIGLGAAAFAAVGGCQGGGGVRSSDPSRAKLDLENKFRAIADKGVSEKYRDRRQTDVLVALEPHKSRHTNVGDRTIISPIRLAVDYVERGNWPIRDKLPRNAQGGIVWEDIVIVYYHPKVGSGEGVNDWYVFIDRKSGKVLHDGPMK